LQGQAIVEYAILIGIVTAAIVGMQVYAKRGIQAGIKLAADQVGNQLDGIRYESRERREKVTASRGDVLVMESASRSTTEPNPGQGVTDPEKVTTIRQMADGTQVRAITNDRTRSIGALPPTRGSNAAFYSEVIADLE